MSSWRVAVLNDVATLKRAAIEPGQIMSGTPYVGLENIESGGSFTEVKPVEAGELASNKFIFTPQHVLYGKLRPYLAKIARPTFGGICSTDILPVLPGPDLDRDYLAHYLLSPAMVAHAASLAAGANLPRLSPNALLQFTVPLPPLSEQRRIAAILDKADDLRAKRRAALGKLDTLTRSIFLDMFGDPATNPRGWPRLTLGDLLAMPLRNGLSPSSLGQVRAKVLTLSAITGAAFDLGSWKESTFRSVPPADQSVRRDDFLICRGNGNLRLVGRGQFATEDLHDTTFPDTMIAARISTDLIERCYLQHVWNSSAVRRQIESLARTTNGTFKVNQEVLMQVTFPLPPRSLQASFGRRLGKVSQCREAQERSAYRLGTLFDSIQQRAFRGEL